MKDSPDPPEHHSECLLCERSAFQLAGRYLGLLGATHESPVVRAQLVAFAERLAMLPAIARTVFGMSTETFLDHVETKNRREA